MAVALLLSQVPKIRETRSSCMGACIMQLQACKAAGGDINTTPPKRYLMP